jgi:nucleoside-diphosphate-sugar epimerase
MSQLILLTGSTGFVGRQVLNELLKSDFHVRCVVRKENRLPASKLIESFVTTQDLFQEEEGWWAKVLEGVATIIHVAWFAEPGKYLNSPKNLDCLIGTLRLAKAAAQSGVRRFVRIGTCAEYQFSDSDLSTETPLDPLSPYAGAKAAAFMSLSRWLPNEGMAFAWCRLFYLYGEGEDARRLVPSIHNQLRAGKPVNLTSGAQIRDFMDVKEAGKQIARVALGEFVGPANICSGIPVSVRQLAEKIADQYDRRDLLQFGARPDNLLDPSRVVGVPTLLE